MQKWGRYAGCSNARDWKLEIDVLSHEIGGARGSRRFGYSRAISFELLPLRIPRGILNYFQKFSLNRMSSTRGTGDRIARCQYSAPLDRQSHLPAHAASCTGAHDMQQSHRYWQQLHSCPSTLQTSPLADPPASLQHRVDQLLSLLRAPPDTVPSATVKATLASCKAHAESGAPGADLLVALLSEAAAAPGAAVPPPPVPPCPAFLYSSEPAFPWAPRLLDATAAAAEAHHQAASPARVAAAAADRGPAPPPEGTGGKRRGDDELGDAALAAAEESPCKRLRPEPQQQRQEQDQREQQPAASTEGAAEAAAAATLRAALWRAAPPPSPLPPEARGVLDLLLAAAAAGRSAPLAAVGLEAVPEHALLSLLGEALPPAASFARCSAVGRAALLPRLQGLQGPPSRTLAAAVGSLAGANPRALVASCLAPLLRSSAFGAPQAELAGRLVKDALPQALLPEVLAAACAPAEAGAGDAGAAAERTPGGATPGAHWNEHTVGVLQALVDARPPLAAPALAALGAALRGAGTGALAPSVKWGKLLLSVVKAYGPALASAGQRPALEAAARSCRSFMAKSVAAALGRV